MNNLPALKDLYFTADDFGRDEHINSAVQIAHESGILNAASLMVTGSACAGAVKLAKAMPRLEVGLHLLLSDGQAALPADQIPQLSDRLGRFSSSPTFAGLRYWISRPARRQLRKEIEAQFALFAATGLELAHVDGHQNMHLHPVIFDCVLPLAQRHGARRIRIPHEELGPALRMDRTRLIGNLLTAAIFAQLERRARRRIANTPLQSPQKTYGLLMSGQMHEEYVLRVLQRLKAESAEIYFHPTTFSQAERLGPNRGDLEALLSDRVRKLLAERASPEGVLS